MRAREKNDLAQWFKFFLVGVIETAKNSIETFDRILKLKEEIDATLQELGSRSSNAHLILNYLFQKPIINAQKAKEITDLSLPTVYKLLEALERYKIIREITGGKRGKLYRFEKYINLFR